MRIALTALLAFAAGMLLMMGLSHRVAPAGAPQAGAPAAAPLSPSAGSDRADA